MKICVYTIAKNEEQFLERWFNSVKDADSVFIIDTGSTDNTLKIAETLGIKTHSIQVTPFRFDTARNAALALLPNDVDICISLDVDELLVDGWRKTVETLWNQTKFTKLSCDYVRPNKEIKFSDKIHSRFGYQWKYAIHEYIVADSRIEEVVVDTPIKLIEHLPNLTKDRGLYHELLKLSTTEEQDSKYFRFNLFQYGLLLYRNNEFAESLKILTKCAELCKTQRSANFNMVDGWRANVEAIVSNNLIKKDQHNINTYIIEPNKKNAVLGVSLGLSLDSVNPFINSFLEHNSRDDLILFVDQPTSDKLKNLSNPRVQVVVFNPSEHTSETRVNNSRFLAYPEFLNKNREKYHNIFLTDVRDVIFQGNIFENLPSNFLYFFTEDSGILINQEKNNSKWIIEDYGQEILEKIGNNNIVCSGTVLGDIDSIIDFLQVLLKEFKHIEESNPEIYKVGYLDQGVFNYIAYDLTKPNFKNQPNGSIIGTLCLSSLSKYAKDKIDIQNDKVTINGIIPAVVHQYDRNKRVFDFLTKKYKK